MLAAACGYTDAGTGSRTLLVNGSISYNPMAEQGASTLRLDVKKEGVSITDAIVQVTDAGNNERYTLHAVGTGYEGIWPGYHRRIAWHIVSGDDNVTCQLEGPGRHTVTAPSHAATHSLGAPLHVTWRTGDGVRAEEVFLRVTPGSYTATLNDDAGTVHIGAPTLEPGKSTISVLRRTAVVPAGAAADSLLYYDYEVQNDFLVTQGS